MGGTSEKGVGEMSEEFLEWAVFAPTTAARLEEVADEFRPPREGWGARYQPRWEVVECGGGYAALLNREPGTRHGSEWAMAKRLSELLGQRVYVVYPGYDPDADGVLVYEGGKCTAELPDDPYEFARGLGCPLPGEPQPQRAERPRTSGGVAVVEGASALEAARALGFDAPPEIEGYDLRIADGPVGALVSREDYADLALAAQRLSEELPGRVVYTVSVGPMPERVLVWVTRDGEGIGYFDTHAGAGAGAGGGPALLDSVKGQTTPVTIAEALGVPPGLLGLADK